MSKSSENVHRPLIGVAAIVTCETIGEDFVLISERLSDKSHGKGYFQLPGGHLEFGGTFEECAQRELKEETNLDCHQWKLIYLTNTIFSKEEGGPKHYLTLFLRGQILDPSKLKSMEKEKNSPWFWIQWKQLKQMKLFQPLHQAVHDQHFHPFQSSTEQHFYLPSSSSLNTNVDVAFN